MDWAMYRNKFSGGAAVWGVVLAVLGAIGLVAVASNNTEQTEYTTVAVQLPYNTTYVEDAELDSGKSVTRVVGVNGLRKDTYRVKKKGGKEISRELTESEVVKEPTDAVVAKGTKPVWKCHDTTSFDRNPYNDNYCEYSDGTGRYVPDSEARRLDPTYVPGRAGADYYNNF